MANDSGKIELAPDVLEPTPEPETSGSLSGDGSGGPPSPRITRFGAGGEGGGGRRERGVVARDNFFSRLGKFFRDTRSEMKRVSWPSMKEVQNTTLITLVAVVFFSLYLFGVDHLWAFVITQLDHGMTWVVDKVTGAA